jgi:Permuted papain-like amidase enzyme, YaeF/YiiX, C92 family
MGLVFCRDGRLYVLEAIATVRFTPLEAWIGRGSGRHFVVKRLKNSAAVLTQANTARLLAEARRFEGKRYDLTFEWSDDLIYCSGLVWKAHERALGMRIGDLQKMREFNLTDRAVRAKLQERYGSAIPLDEPVISPAVMYASPLLERVAER